MTQLEFEKEWTDNSEYVVCHTSGSTGIPKEIKLSKEFMRESARRTNEFFSINDKSHLHTCLDFCYIASKMMVVRAEEAQCRLTSEHPSNRPLGEIGKEERIDLLSLVPSQMEWILDSGAPWTGIRNILVGGSAVPPMMRRKIALSEYVVWETYGMTETASHIALRRVVENESLPFETLHGISVSNNNEGCLVVMLPGGEIIETNDLAEVLGPTEFRILGRADNCIISGGIKIIPEELEKQLGPFIAFNYCISSLPDKKWGEKLVLAVETNEVNLDEDILKKAIGVRLNQYKKVLNLGVKAPKEVVCMSAFPKTPNGKIDRRTLKEMLKKIV